MNSRRLPQVGDRVRVSFPDAPRAPAVCGYVLSTDMPGLVLLRLDLRPYDRAVRILSADTRSVEVIS